MKKIDDLKIPELFKYFKKEICELVRFNFSHASKAPIGERELEPIVFVGVRKSVMDDKALGQAHLMDRKRSKYEDGMTDEEKDRAIHVIALPLGKFFSLPEDIAKLVQAIPTLGPSFDDMGKIAGRAMVASSIKKFSEKDINAVMFTAFVSEAFMIEAKADPKTKKKMDTDQMSKDEFIDQEFKKAGIDNVRDHPDAKERVIITFETRTHAELVTYGILRSDSYQELNDEQNSPSVPVDASAGLFSGLLRTESSPTNMN